jgi:hypothetical protein
MARAYVTGPVIDCEGGLMRSKGCISVTSDGCGFLWQRCCQRSFKFGALLLTSFWPG